MIDFVALSTSCEVPDHARGKISDMGINRFHLGKLLSVLLQIGTCAHDTPKRPHPCPHFLTTLVEETDDLSGNVLATSLLVVHDTGRGGKNDVSELTGWQ